MIIVTLDATEVKPADVTPIVLTIDPVPAADERTDEEWEAMAEAAYADEVVSRGYPWL